MSTWKHALGVSSRRPGFPSCSLREPPPQAAWGLSQSLLVKNVETAMNADAVRQRKGQLSQAPLEPEAARLPGLRGAVLPTGVRDRGPAHTLDPDGGTHRSGRRRGSAGVGLTAGLTPGRRLGWNLGWRQQGRSLGLVQGEAMGFFCSRQYFGENIAISVSSLTYAGKNVNSWRAIYQ